MDSPSMTASIIAVLQLTTSLASCLIDVQHATPDQKRLAIQVTSLTSLLTSLRYRVEEAHIGDEWFDQVKSLSASNGPLEELKRALERMAERTSLATSKERDEPLAALKWSFTRVQVHSSLNQIERSKSLVSIALSKNTHQLSQAIHNDATHVGALTQQVHHTVEQLHTQADRDTHEKLARWLATPDPSTNYRNALKKRQPGTGSWLLTSQAFQSWNASKSSLLWLFGKAGCGKTVLSATALEHILQIPANVVAYFYFDFNDPEKQSSEKAVRSLVLQCAVQLSNALQDVEQLYHQCNDGAQQPGDDQVRLLLYALIKGANQKQVYIVLDALDECRDQDMLYNFLEELVASPQHELCVLTTSRAVKNIDSSLRPIANHAIDIQSGTVDLDIDAFVRSQLETDRKLRKWPTSVKDEIATELLKKADGMFRWADCQVEMLRGCVQLRDLRRALSTLPQTLDETYARILDSIEADGHLASATKLLQWLCFAGRPLLLSELVEVLAIVSGEDGKDGFDSDERLPDPEDVMIICSSLISHYTLPNRRRNKRKRRSRDHKEDVWQDGNASESEVLVPKPSLSPDKTYVRLAHFSVKEYLLSTRCSLRFNFHASMCHTIISKNCLLYLQHVSQGRHPTLSIAAAYPLARYAAEFWWRHAQEAGEMSLAQILDLVYSFLTTRDSLLAWQQLCNIDEKQGFECFVAKGDIRQAAPLYYAAQLGLVGVTRRLVASQVNVNAEGGKFGTALIAASIAGHEMIVQILIDAGADTSVYAASKSATALSVAASKGHERIVQMLISAGANPNMQTSSHIVTAIVAACNGGYDKIVRILINAGADVKMGEPYANTALYDAAYKGYEEIVRMLIDAGAEVNAPCGGRWFRFALQAAQGHEKTTRTLIDAGADVNASGGFYSPVIIAASIGGSEKTVQMLIEKGADVNADSTDGGGRGYYATALQAASRNGHEKVVRMLIDAGAEVNKYSAHARYGTALQAASVGGHEEIVQLLVDEGADVNLPPGGKYNGPALQAAAAGNHESIVRILIDAGANVNTPGGSHYGTALEAARRRGNETMIQMLVEAGAVDSSQNPQQSRNAP